MASISREANGRRTIQVVCPDGKRRSVRLGKVSQRHAESVKVKVEHLAAAAETRGPLDPETARWVAELDSTLADKLAAVGLIPPREKATVAGFIDAFIAKRTDVKPGTVIAYRQGRDSLVEFLGADTPLRDIKQGDADEFRLKLLEKYAEATVGRRIKHAKQFFKAAVRRPAGRFPTEPEPRLLRDQGRDYQGAGRMPQSGMAGARGAGSIRRASGAV
jgi:hypothetical protein